MIPDYQTIMLPLLKEIEDGKEYHIREITEKLARVFKLTEEERKKLLPSGQETVFDNRVGWARTYMKNAGLLESPKRGFIKITQRGIDVLKEGVEKINNDFLMRFDEFKEFIEKSKRGKTKEKVYEPSQFQDDKSPEEQIEDAFLSYNQILKSELLEKLLQVDPSKFERIVVDILTSMGYGGSFEEASEVIGRSGDEGEGINGIIKQDPLGLDVVYIQAKKWDKSTIIGKPEIQKFVGALQGKHTSKGVFITTAKFSNEAKEYVKNIPSKIILIDGETIAELMIKHNVGVTVLKKIELKKVDGDYFE